MLLTSLCRPLKLSIVGAALLTSPLTAHQQFVLSSQDRARLTAVDFAAFSPDGTPIADLTAADVTLKIDGRTRQIRSLEYVSPAAKAPRVSAPFSTNAVADDARTVLLIIDDETLRPGREKDLKDDVVTFLGRLGGNDRVALATVPYGGIKADFTTDHARLVNALGAIVGRAPQVESASDAGCRSRSTLVALASTLESLSAGDAPTTVVFFAGGLVGPKGVESLTAGDNFKTIGTCEVLTEHYTQVSAAVARARAQLYVVMPELGADNSGRAGLEHLTGLTGAPLWNLRSSDDTAMDRVAVQSGGYYLARIELEPSESSELVRGYHVTSNRPGVTIRHRPQLQLRRPTGGVARPPKVTSPLEMMREARLFTDLPLRVSAATSRNADGSLKVLAVFDAPGTDALTTAMVGLFDGTGRMVSSTAVSAAELAASPYVTAVTAPAGNYRLRVAAMDRQARAGAADVDVNVELTKAGPLTLSSVIIGQNRPEGFTPRLEFTTQATALAMLELYGGTAGTPVGVAFEVATSLNGPALITMPGAFSATAEADKFLVTAVIPVGGLPPGDYAVRAIVAAQGQPGGRVVRTIRKLASR